MKNTIDLIQCLTTNRERGIIIWLFNINPEKFWGYDNFTLRDEREDMVVNRIEEISLLLTRKQDVLILRNKPEKQFLQDLQNVGFDIPTILCPQNKNEEKSISQLVLQDDILLNNLKELGHIHEDVYFVPYGVTYLEENIAEICELNLIGGNLEVIKKINSKVFSRKLSQTLGFKTTQGKICKNLKDVETTYYNLKNECNKIIIKSPKGASGKGLYVVDNDRKLLSTLMILEKLAKVNGETEWIIEKWYEKKEDINYQVYVDELGNVTTFSIKEQIVDGTIYIGSVMPPRVTKQTCKEYEDYGEKIGKELYLLGFNGVLGIDSIITTENQVIPIIEINARFTLSTYLSFLAHKFPDKIIHSFFVRVYMKQKMNYGEFNKFLKDRGIAFNQVCGYGVLCYNAATLECTENQTGRLFLMIIADNSDQVDNYKKDINIIIDEITVKGHSKC